MDVVVIGLPGSGKSAVGRQVALANGAEFVDVDETIERTAGTSVAEIFASEGESGFRARECEAINDLGPSDAATGVRRVIAPGGGAVVDPRNRWRLFRDRTALWLDVPPEILARRLRHSPAARPLLAVRDPLHRIRKLARERGRFYAAARRVDADGPPEAVDGAVAAAIRDREGASPVGTTLLRAATAIGELVIGDGILAAELSSALHRLEARRAILVSEAGAWGAIGPALEETLSGAGWPVEKILLPSGESAKRLAVLEDAARELARRRVERDEPLVAVGGGALGDVVGFLAASYLRGVPWIQAPTTLLAQIDASIGGKTGVDLPEGKNLLGAFHQPAAIILDIANLRTLDASQRRSALAEAVKMAALGDGRLFEVLEADGPRIAAGDPGAVESGAVAEVVERAAWAKAEVVTADELESSGRIALNLGHSLGHALEAAAGFAGLPHGEAVAYGLRAACRIGVALGLTPPDRAARIEALLDRLGLGRDPLRIRPADAVAVLETDKKRHRGRLRWVLPTADGHAVEPDVPTALVAEVAAAVIAGVRAPRARGGNARLDVRAVEPVAETTQ